MHEKSLWDKIPPDHEFRAGSRRLAQPQVGVLWGHVVRHVPRVITLISSLGGHRPLRQGTAATPLSTQEIELRRGRIGLVCRVKNLCEKATGIYLLTALAGKIKPIRNTGLVHGSSVTREETGCSWKGQGNLFPYSNGREKLPTW